MTFALWLIPESPSSRLFPIFLFWNQEKPAFKCLLSPFAPHRRVNSLYPAQQQQARGLSLWGVPDPCQRLVKWVPACGQHLGSSRAQSQTWDAGPLESRRQPSGAWRVWNRFAPSIFGCPSFAYGFLFCLFVLFCLCWNIIILSSCFWESCVICSHQLCLNNPNYVCLLELLLFTHHHTGWFFMPLGSLWYTFVKKNIHLVWMC